jgi:hypothetical protein
MFTLHFAGGQYRLPIHLGPRATQMLTLSEIVQNQIPDAEGNTIPPTVKDGSATLAGAQGDNQEILVAMDAGTYNVHKATCTWYCITCNGSIYVYTLVNPFALAKGGQTTLSMWGQQNTGGAYQLYGPSWSSSNTGVASVGSSSGVVTGVAPGAVSMYANLQSTPSYTTQDCGYNYPYCPYYLPVQATGSGNVVQLNCTASVARGGSATCSVTPSAGVTVSGWKFKDGSGNTVTSSSTSLTWSGTMVVSGTVTVSATASGATTPLSASITVNGRNWHTSASSPAEVANGTFRLLPVPPATSGNDGGVGASQETVGNSPFSGVSFVSDNGPNKGYGYYANMPTFQTSYNYEINPDLENTGSTFYQNQCGNYSANNPSGFISGNNLLTQTRRHEYNGSTQSHYAFYSSSLSSPNNPGDYVESRVATPGTSGSSFDSATSSGLNTLYQNVLSAFSVEPFAVNDDANGSFLGKINYAPYTSCN